MELSKRMKRRIFIQTLFFAACFLLIGAAFGYWYAMAEMSAKFLTELK